MDLGLFLRVDDHVAGNRSGRTGINGSYRLDRHLWLALGREQAIGLLLGVSELGVAEPGETRGVEHGRDEFGVGGEVGFGIS